MEEYNTVGLETFIPPAPVVQTALTAAGRDRGSSDVMDEVEFSCLVLTNICLVSGYFGYSV